MALATDIDLPAIAAAAASCDAVAASWLFGSLARGEGRPSSDLDLAVLIHADAGPRVSTQLTELSLALERHSPSGRVDVVILGRQGPVFRHRVIKEGVLVLDRDPALRRAFEARTIIDYLDWKPTHDIAMASTMAGLRRRFAGAAR
ncbi:MAG TPA: nucleotidyltransferase domain-containing protein [Nannocystaceae bacterium]|nr:nucleotidyltransferase domain-containing protein [Nannocystaceae bacterium]